MPERTLSHYKVIRKIGQGGMGEVYLAEDTALKREVAIKFLPESVRHDPERLRRFRIEAEAAAKLNHPNIATVHSIEEAEGELFITMEYVDGKPLGAHIGASGLDLDTFLRWFLSLTDGLAHAHEQGLVHRDLKPANMMIRNDGTPKILDFGLARIVALGEHAAGMDSEAPTKNVEPRDENALPSLTAAGALLGTPAYMSPEQIEGKRVDARTDLFSMGVVMYEALTGQRPFQGATVESIIARILEIDPEPLTALKPVTPYPLWSTIRRCLKKDRDLRIPTARILHEELRDVQQEVSSGTVLVDAGAVSPATAGRSRWGRAVAIAATLLALTLGILAGRFLVPSTPEPPLRKWQIEVPVAGGFSFDDWPKVSRDGTKVAYIQRNRLWIRELDELKPREISDSDGARYAFWSPQSDIVGYFNEDGLHTVSTEGGPSIRFAEISLSRSSAGGAVVRVDGSILIATGGPAGLLVVSADGGAPRTFAEPETARGELDFHEPSPLPDGRGILVVGHTEEGVDEILLITEEARQTLVHFPGEVLHQPIYASSGHIVFQRGSEIWGVLFSLSDLAVDGAPFRLAHNAVAPSISEDGTLVYLQAGVEAQLAWVDRDGRVSGTVGQPQPLIWAPVLSPDGERIAAMTATTAREVSDLWVQEVSRGTKTRLTDDSDIEYEPAWSPDGARIAFQHAGNIFTVAADGRGGAPEQLVPGTNPSWSHDGRYLVYHSRTEGPEGDLWYLPLGEDSSAPVPLLQSAYNDGAPQFSPDTRHVAYVSDQSGREEVYVTDFPGGEERHAVSANGGVHPRWSPKGDALFYLEGERLMEVSVHTDPTFRTDAPRSLFTAEEAEVSFESTGPFGAPPYDVHPDGEKFLVVRTVVDEENPPAITVVENSFREFDERE